jgi:cytochrome P450
MMRGVPAIMRDPLTWLRQCVRRHGDLVAFPLPRSAVLLVNTPAGARRVLQENHRNYTKETIQYGALSLVTGEGLLTSDGEAWRSHRRVMQPAFHHGGLDGVAAHTLAAARSLKSRWDDVSPAPVDVDAATMRAMLEVVGRTLLNGDLTDSGDAERVVHAVEEALSVVLARAKTPLPMWASRRLRRARATLDEVCATVIARRRAAGVDDEDGDLLALLLRSGLTDHEIRNELVTLVIAGHETVASALTWSLYLLAANPAVQEQLHRELDEVLGDRSPAWPDLARLPYTRAVVDESLRLYPPAWIITRRSVAEDTLDGVTIPARTLVLVSPWLLHRRADVFPAPEVFDPARFLDGPGRSVRGEYVPFGLGPRLCIGRDFALVEAVLTVAELLRDRAVELPAGAREPKVDALVTLRPKGGLRMILRPRPATYGSEGSQISNC